MWALARVLVLIGACLFLSSCRYSSQTQDDSGLNLSPVSYSALPNWNDDGHFAALETFLRSCVAVNRRNGSDAMGPAQVFGQVSTWQRICRRAANIPKSDSLAKAFFEATFQPYSVAGQGTFTGYYEVAVQGSRQRTSRFSFPVYGRPDDLNSRSPYYSRTQIDEGILAGRGLEIMYLETAADAFLLHVQGSGAIQLTDGSSTRLSYAANNGHSFRSILPALKSAGYDVSVEGATMVDYRRWLNENPRRAIGAIQANPRYIFFGEHQGSGPIGAQGIALTPGRSMAVDRDHLALGIPIYLNTQFIDPNRNNARRPLQRLMIAQDTGAAINGKVRGDFYWGTGEAALQYAGSMKEEGRYILLLPR